jgi:hypothetical protein
VDGVGPNLLHAEKKALDFGHLSIHILLRNNPRCSQAPGFRCALTEGTFSYRKLYPSLTISARFVPQGEPQKLRHTNKRRAGARQTIALPSSRYARMGFLNERGLR